MEEAAEVGHAVVVGAVIASTSAVVEGVVSGAVVTVAANVKERSGKTLGRLRSQRGLFLAQYRTTSLACPPSRPYSPTS